MQVGFPVPHFSPAYADPCFCRSGEVFGKCCGSSAPDRKLPAGVQVFPGFVDEETCRKWVTRLEQQPRQRTTISDVNQSPNRVPVARPDPARVCDDVAPGVLRKKINDEVLRGFTLGARVTGRNLEWYETPRILRYQTGGLYQRHADSCQVYQHNKAWYKVRDRDLSLLLYLNEEFTGGGLTFINFDFHYRPKVGDLLVFPSDNRYEHCAEKVTSGIRYAVVSWAAYTGGQRVFAIPPKSAIQVKHPTPGETA